MEDGRTNSRCRHTSDTGTGRGEGRMPVGEWVVRIAFAREEVLRRFIPGSIGIVEKTRRSSKLYRWPYRVVCSIRDRKDR